MAAVQPNLSKIIKRLELIKGLIALEEPDEIASHIAKLEQNELPKPKVLKKEQSYLL